ncbi:MAG TPA: zf-HC2 domain-containing protein [Clostridia bacterium]|nr:zf-HC2 domain-containing protein [Clostridia bacterium]
MDHSEAIKMIAAEKYLLGELTASERDAFEDHYFSCEECAADVKSAAVFVDNVREVLRAELAPRKAEAAVDNKRSWFAWLRPAYAAPLLAILLVVVGYQNFVTIPRMNRGKSAAAPQALATFSLVTAGSRSGSGITIAVEKNTPFGLYFDIPSSSEFSSYSCEVQSESGKRLFSVGVPAQQARDSVQLLIPGATLESGQYYLVVLGNRNEQAASTPGQEVARLPFAVRVK